MRPMPKLEVVEVPTGELIEYKNNPKLHPASQIDQIVSSIEEVGYYNPILAWHNDNGEPEIVSGHGRLMAARKLGIEELPVIFLDYMSDEQRRVAVLLDNQLTINSGYDMGILQGELDAITSIDMSQFDFDVDFEIPDDFAGPDTVGDTAGGEPTGQDMGSTPKFNYAEQYAVIVMCADEGEQERTYNRLVGEGYTCKVVAV